MPAIDPIQNVELLSAEETGGTTTLEFRRKLEACDDPEKDRTIEVSYYKLFSQAIRLCI